MTIVNGGFAALKFRTNHACCVNNKFRGNYLIKSSLLLISVLTIAEIISTI